MSRVLIYFMFTDIAVIITAMNQDKIEAIKKWLGSGSINIFGGPFSGKDTQGKILAKLFNGVFISSGHILRENTKPEEVKEHMGSGKMFPMQDFKDIVFPCFNQSAYTDKPLILSSVGRWHGEEEGVLSALKESNHSIKAIVYLQLDETTAWERWKAAKHIQDRGIRDDDHPESLKIRQKEYTDKTLPVIDFYKDKSLLIEIDGNQSPDAVTSEIIDKLYEFSRAST